MRIQNTFHNKALGLAVFLLAAFISGCNHDDNTGLIISPTDLPTDLPTILPSNASVVLVNNTALTIISTNPHNDATAVPANNTIIATFSENMDEATLTVETFTVETFTVDEASRIALLGSVSLDAASNTASFTPTFALSDNNLYTATITTQTKSSTGQSLASDYVWTFTSSASHDGTPPTVSSTNPNNTEVDIALNRNISAFFNEFLHPASINPTSFTLTAHSGNTVITGEVSYSNKLAIFNPTDNLSASTAYTATLTTDIKDLAGNSLDTNDVWQFTTGTTTEAATGPVPVDLLTAGNFAILTETGITNSTTSTITGNIGSSITASSIDVSCSEMTDTDTIYGIDGAYVGDTDDKNCYTEDATLVNDAILNMRTAYTDAEDRLDHDFTELDISGQILLPGLYKWATTVAIDADTILYGDENDVWIFQIGTTFKQAANTSVLLTGGALAKNVFWQTGETLTLGAGANFAGVVLAKTAIPLGAGATVNGRLLAQTAVTLITNTITEPAP